MKNCMQYTRQFPCRHQLFYASLLEKTFLKEGVWAPPLGDQAIEIMDPKLLEFPWNLMLKGREPAGSWRSLSP